MKLERRCRREGCLAMNVIEAIEIIRSRLKSSDGDAKVPLLKGGKTFRARLVDAGIEVDNLAGQPFLPWAAFQEAICVMIRNHGKATRGDAMNSRLGEPGLPLDSIEGHIAQIVYGKQPGDAVFRRITPVACILIWAGICRAGPGTLELLD